MHWPNFRLANRQIEPQVCQTARESESVKNEHCPLRDQFDKIIIN